ncbi:MAG TPA: endonuclease/exonuclease/phosphatase [Cyanobacteria bacterium UBA8803]|nr:endonuclease/exonuclease/phosphatase [Cyanobacteria bacterium UBA9273]HBL60259.1 endonuclease/exonuclease/phosphatase [Cyanobacteria bacterium UBA8803]
MVHLLKLNGLKLQTSRLLVSLLLVIAIALLSLLTVACSPGQARTAEQRRFVNLAIDFLGEYQLPKMKFQDTPVGGLSALAYDRQSGRFLTLSDDRSTLAPARFYTLNITIAPSNTNQSGITQVEVEKVTFLKDENGETYAKGSIDPEGLALSAKGTVFVSSEGVPSRGITPFIREFDRQTGQPQQSLRIPDRYLPGAMGQSPNTSPSTEEEQLSRGIQENLGFEALTLEPTSLAAATGDPFRLFVATESALFQDRNNEQSLTKNDKNNSSPHPSSLIPHPSTDATRIRLMHYLIGDIAQPMLVAEHLYLLDPAPKGTIDNGLTELVALDTQGRFLSLERTYGLFGVRAKIYQISLGGATDTSNIASLSGDISQIVPVQKKLLLDLSELGIYLDNLEGMTLGPRLPDGSQSLLLVSDDNFSDTQLTQFLMFSLKSENQTQTRSK